MSSVPLNHLLKIGSEVLTTTAQTLSGAVNELKSSITTAISNALSSVDNFDDVIISNPENDQQMVYDSTAGAWKNKTVEQTTTFAELTDTDVTGIADGSYAKYNSNTSKWEMDNNLGAQVAQISGQVDLWSSQSMVTQVGNNLMVSFDDLNDNYGYDLYGVDKVINYIDVTKTTGTNSGVKLTYTVANALVGDYCKLRILR